MRNNKIARTSGPLAIDIDYGYRSLTLRTRGVHEHLHLRVVATRRYSKS